MALAWILLIFSFRLSHIQTLDVYQPSFVSVKPGEEVTVNCTFPQNSVKDLVVLYKQSLGKLPQEVGTWLEHTDAKLSADFLSSRFKLERIINGVSLTIKCMEKNDEGMYFCGITVWKKVQHSSGTFLALRVVQSPDVERVPPGESVSLQCSVLSERRTAELQVFWFRSSAGDSHPEIISTHHNSSRQCEISSSPHSCVYNLSKSVLSVSDTGTYYCAVITCGKILLGNGTTVQLKWSVDPVTVSMAAALGVCVIVIVAQATFNCRRKKSENCCEQLHQHTEAARTNQDHGGVDISYVALQFSRKKRNSETGKRIQDTRYKDTSVYSEVKCPPVTTH
ncbi:uncharacterized protein LOC143527578 isoform X2 [Brachyhypopomus gauderio]|uniref:uncharacterized protein LOC143527578 isoform X2 n=1 Tax=Brachyhypopomus gauderio TaxID=698409 RepID=UPI004040EEE5